MSENTDATKKKIEECVENDEKGFDYYFHQIAVKLSEVVGNAWTFVAMLIAICGWLICGPIYNYSANWQAIIQIVTAIITFLMVFAIQNTQNRDTKTIHIKLDELIRVHGIAHNSIIDLEKLSDKQIKELEKHFQSISNKEDNHALDEDRKG